ncbi:Knottin [Corchorus capsularis]|nr:Knottin [Corchorus capsularis]
MAEARKCVKRSQTWSGVCGISSHCARQCKTWEKAKRGGFCDWDGFGRACFCKFC